ncbi:autophagy- protein 2, partial [Kappamyces sp. JEL0680]
TSKMYIPGTQRSPCIKVTLKKPTLGEDWIVAVLTSPLLLEICYENFKGWKSYLPSKQPRQSAQLTSQTPTAGLLVSLDVSHLRLLFDMTSDLGEGLTKLVLDVSTVRIRGQGPKWSLQVAQFLAGLASVKEIGSIHHLVSLESIEVSSKELEGTGGLSEELIVSRHDYCRESTVADGASSKSWSDVGDSETEQLPPREAARRAPPTNADLMHPSLETSKYVVTANVAQGRVDVSPRQIYLVQWVLDTVARWNAKSPPEPTQFPACVLVKINQVMGKICDGKCDPVFTARDVDLLLAFNSIDMAKNLTMMELFCGQLYASVLLPNLDRWRFINHTSNLPARKAMVHILFTQNDDLEIDVRQMKLTAIMNDALVNIPATLPHWTAYESFDKKEDLNSSSSFLDLFVLFQNSQVSHGSSPLGVLRADTLQVTTNVISESPTSGVSVGVSNLNGMLGTNPELVALVQHDVESRSLSFLEILLTKRCVPVVSLDVLHAEIRTNQPGVFPTHDYSFGFNQLMIETCTDSRDALLHYISQLSPAPSDHASQFSPQASPTSPDAVEINTFEAVDDAAFRPKTSTHSETHSDFDFEVEEVEDEVEWHMDFESTHLKEDILVDKITLLKSLAKTVVVPDYLNQLQPIPDDTVDSTPEIKVAVTEGNISWRLYPGSDFAPREPSDDGDGPDDLIGRELFQMEVHILRIAGQFLAFPSQSANTKYLKLQVRDIEVYDKVPQSKFRKFFCYQAPDVSLPPRVSESNMLELELVGIRVEKEELRIKLTVLPMEIHIDQDLVLFLESFFSDTFKSSEPSLSAKAVDETFIQYCEIAPISIQVDYKPKHIDYSSIKQGELMELVNFIHLDEAKIYLSGIKLTGVQGLSGMKTLVNLGSGIADLVLLPIEQYQKDGRIIRGITRGTRSFLKATTKETVRLGSTLAFGAQTLLETAEKSHTASSRPTDASAAETPQAVPVTMLKPLIRITGALADTLVRLSTSIDGTRQYSSKFK